MDDPTTIAALEHRDRRARGARGAHRRPRSRSRARHHLRPTSARPTPPLPLPTRRSTDAACWAAPAPPRRAPCSAAPRPPSPPRLPRPRPPARSPRWRSAGSSRARPCWSPVMRVGPRPAFGIEVQASSIGVLSSGAMWGVHGAADGLDSVGVFGHGGLGYGLMATGARANILMTGTRRPVPPDARSDDPARPPTRRASSTGPTTASCGCVSPTARRARGAGSPVPTRRARSRCSPRPDPGVRHPNRERAPRRRHRARHRRPPRHRPHRQQQRAPHRRHRRPRDPHRHQHRRQPRRLRPDLRQRPGHASRHQRRQLDRRATTSSPPPRPPPSPPARSPSP